MTLDGMKKTDERIADGTGQAATQNVQTAGPSDRMTMLKMEKCAAFVAQMLEKYGEDVLREIGDAAVREGNPL